MRHDWRVPAEIWPGLFGGLLSGLVGALVFATAHALLIVPIWSSMGSGLLFGALAGVSFGWALVEHYPTYAEESLRRAAGSGARFGAALWVLVAPVTAVDAVLRATGVTPRLELVAVAVVLAIGSGAVAGWYHTRRHRGLASGALATLMLTIAMAGPVPIGRSVRALAIFLAVLPAAVIAGSVLTLTARQVSVSQSRRLKRSAAAS